MAAGPLDRIAGLPKEATGLKPKRKQQRRVIASRLVYHGPLFDVRHERVREPGGIVATRDVIIHFGSIVLVPVLDDGRILLVRQYRHSAGQFLWELVAGRIERGEQPVAAARRELTEETGYSGSQCRRLTEFFPTPGYVTERMLLYLVKGLTPGKARPESDEKIRVGVFRLADLERKIRDGAIRDGKTIAGVLFYSRFVSRDP
jgi:ADP-ribose pyrophosphatase